VQQNGNIVMGDKQIRIRKKMAVV